MASPNFLTRFDPLFKDFYQPRVYETINNKNPFFKLLEKRTKEPFNGRELQFAIHNGRNEGTGFRRLGGTVTNAGSQGHSKGRLTDALYYGAIELHQHEIATTKNDRGAFKKVLENEMKGMVTDTADHFAFAAYGFPPEFGSKAGPQEQSCNAYDNAIGVGAKAVGDGVSSLNMVRCISVAAPVGNTIKVGYPGGYYRPSGQDIGGTRYLRVGMKLAFGTLKQLQNGQAAGFLRVTAINSTTQVMSFVALGAVPVNPAVNMAFVKCSSPDDILLTGHEGDVGLCGLGHLYSFKVDANADYSTAAANIVKTFEGITTTITGDETWRPFVQASGGVWNEMEVLDLIANMDEFGGGSASADLMVSHSSLQREFISTLSKQVQYEPQMFKAGFKMIEFAADRPMRWVADRWCPYGTIFVLSPDDLYWAVREDLHWDDSGGSVLKSLLVGATGGEDKVRGIYKSYMQLAWANMNTHGFIDGINVSSTLK